jgi:hypothetical protein
MSIIYEALKKAEKGSFSNYSNKDEPSARKINFKKVFTFTLVFGIVFFAAYNFSNSAKTKKAGVIILPPKQKASINKLPKKASQLKTQKRTPAYTLEGIIFDKNRPFAVINGKKVYQGDEIDKFKVSEIKKDSVKLKEKEGEKSKILSISF